MPCAPDHAAVTEIPLLDVRRGGPVDHAKRSREAMLRLREACFSVVPAPLRGIAKPLDRLSRAWLARSPSPYVGEIAAIAEMAGKPGVWFVNASYEWGCTTRIDVAPEPLLRRTLDWPFPGLGRHVQVAVQDGGAGCYANVTWPGAVGVLTAVAPGRFAAAINQAPLYRRADAAALLPADFLLNGLSTWRHAGRWPAAHLLRFAFDRCGTYDEAMQLLASTPLARPTLFSLVGAQPGQGCLIERTETEAVVHEGAACIANDLAPQRPASARPLGPTRELHPRDAEFRGAMGGARQLRVRDAVCVAGRAGPQRPHTPCRGSRARERAPARRRPRAELAPHDQGRAGHQDARCTHHVRRHRHHAC